MNLAQDPMPKVTGGQPWKSLCRECRVGISRVCSATYNLDTQSAGYNIHYCLTVG